MTIFVSTHYMEEADKLCDKIAIIDYGKIQVQDTPQNMKNALGNEIITLTTKNGTGDFLSKIHEIPYVKKITTNNEKTIVYSSRGTEVIPLIFQVSIDLGIKINTISLTQPTLDDVFISYTGRELRDDTSKKQFNRKKEHNQLKRRNL